MKKTASLLEQRFKKSNTQKMKALVQQRSQGNLLSLEKTKQNAVLAKQDSLRLSELLKKYALQEIPSETDLSLIANLTAEIKIISHQAIILHGERIKKAQIILKNYQEGAFSAWLLLTYNNRQTPYNFLSYYELYLQLSPDTKLLLEQMPKQLAYALALRNGAIEKKERIIEGYDATKKTHLLNLIRSSFPLNKNDARRHNPAEAMKKLLSKTLEILKDSSTILNKKDLDQVDDLLKKIEIAKNNLV